MQQFFSLVKNQLGVDEYTSKLATGNLFHMIQGAVGNQDFNHLMDTIPDAKSIIEGAASSSLGQSGTGLMGSVMSKAGAAMGGDFGAMLDAGNFLKKSGINVDQAPQFVSMFFSYAKEQSGTDLITKILGQLPQIQKLIQ